MGGAERGGGPVVATTSWMRVCGALGEDGLTTRGGIGPLTTSVILSRVGGSTRVFTLAPPDYSVRRRRHFGRSSGRPGPVLAVIGSRNGLAVRAAHPGQGGIEQLLEFAVRLAVVLPTALDHLMRDAAAIHLGNLDHAAGLSGHLLVRQEVMPQPVEQGRRALVNVGPIAVRRVAFQHGDDFVVG